MERKRERDSHKAYTNTKRYRQEKPEIQRKNTKVTQGGTYITRNRDLDSFDGLTKVWGTSADDIGLLWCTLCPFLNNIKVGAQEDPLKSRTDHLIFFGHATLLPQLYLALISISPNDLIPLDCTILVGKWKEKLRQSESRRESKKS